MPDKIAVPCKSDLTPLTPKNKNYFLVYFEKHFGRSMILLLYQSSNQVQYLQPREVKTFLLICT